MAMRTVQASDAPVELQGNAPAVTGVLGDQSLDTFVHLSDAVRMVVARSPWRPAGCRFRSVDARADGTAAMAAARLR
jgi:hypothetical protein